MGDNLSIEKITAVFDSIERDINVSSWEIDGLKIWPAIRNNHWLYLLSKKVFNPNNQIALNNNRTKQLKKIVSAGASFIRAAYQDKAKNDRFRKTDLIVAVTSSTRFFKIKEAWYTPYSDSLIKHFHDEHIDSLVLEFASDGRCLFPRFAPSIFVQNQSYYLSIQARVMEKLNIPRAQESIEGWEDFLAIIDKELGPGCQPHINTVRTKARQILLHEQWFQKILHVTQPKVAIVGFSYCSAEAMAFIRACRKQNILTIEIQHGVQGNEHIAYHKWSQLPAEGYDTLPEIFWTWGEDEKRNIDLWAQYRPKAHRAIVGGNPCLYIYDSKDPGDAKTQNSPNPEVKHQSIDKKSDVSPSLNILFTAQAFDTLPEFLIETIRQTPNWNWWIRIHPQYWEMKAPLQQQLISNNLSNATISTSSELPLIRLLGQCNVHVTEFSSSVLEAKSCGIGSVVIHPSGVNIFKELIASGHVVYADSADSLISSIMLQGKKEWHGIHLDNDTCFFPDIMNEIKSRIDSVRKEKICAES